MEEKKKTFIAYIDDDGEKKEVWIDVLEKTISYIVFKYHDEQITIPFHRILKIKEKGEWASQKK